MFLAIQLIIQMYT